MHEQTPATRRDERRRGAAPGLDGRETGGATKNPAASARDAGPRPSADAATDPSGASPSDADDARTTASPAASGTPADSAHTAPVASGALPTASGAPVDQAPTASASGAPAPAAPGAPVLIGALTWLDPADAADTRPAPAFVVSGAATRPADLLAGRRRRRLRPATVIPPVLIVLILGLYAAATLLWPLNAVAPTTRAVGVQPAAAPAASPAWPAEGEAAIAIDGVAETLTTGATAPESIASITKVVTALVVLDRLPLAPGEQGPSYAFTQTDSADYWQYRARGESSLDVPVDGSLTELQMLQGMLIASANNYAQRLATDLFGTDAEFSAAANQYLAERGIEGITIVNPTGIEEGNTATPAALIALAERALANPVIAEIVRTRELTLPGAGTFSNGNALLADPGVVGIKTGTLDAWNLLTAKDITVGDATIRAYAAVLGQPGPDTRNQATRDLFARIEQELQPTPSVTAGTVVGKVETRWSDDIDLVTTADATVVLWNGGAAQASASFDLGEATDSGTTVGTFTATGPVDADTVDVRLAGEIEPPSPWWRLTHPLDLFGLND
ncbi:D-alanyl-D-alanine carboxypeptidase [Microbacterium sp. lyk4-40-TSB-66]|uniref:D-alanyl-D-alanine carboxypeptidase family protein n=1 Tax=Microbacterium sp. lyk4-40-TSB-66 TaxID=3040294 RepID=UPI0025518994|nr:D-alanyl-D-alanine carboxypeptidase [Microbacterium sp. lyk4-40-TSB-66]